MRTHFVLSTLLFLPLSLAMSETVQAEPRSPSSELFLPSFEVRIQDSGPDTLTTVLAVVNPSDEVVESSLSVKTNWGIEVLHFSVLLAPREAKTFNLADWIVAGQLPSTLLSPEELDHLQSTLTGQMSPLDGLYYSAEGNFGVATGSVVISTACQPLWGDFFVADPSEDTATAELLANLDPSIGPTGDAADLCRSHVFRFLEGGAFDGGTAFSVWSPLTGTPVVDPHYSGPAVPAQLTAYAMDGQLLETLSLDFRPQEAIRIDGLGLPEQFGWLQVDTEPIATHISVKHTSVGRFAVVLDSICLPTNEEASLTLIKHVINDDGGTLSVADFPLFINGVPVTSGVAEPRPPGTYTASEQNSSSYLAGPWTGDCAADGSVSLAPGEHKVCEITNDDLPTQTQGHMTGAAGITNEGVRYSYTFDLSCDSSGPHKLMVNLGKGNRFELSNLSISTCSDQPGVSEGTPIAGFDTLEAQGTGILNGIPGAAIRLKFVDAGEPGRNVDSAAITIVPPSSDPEIVIQGIIASGNHEARPE